MVDPAPPEGLQRIYYDTGVGTAGLVDRVTGGMLGRGLSANVLEAYRFLSHTYQEGDNVYVFGFSRGAFTARSLCGFLAASGLLRAEHCDRKTEERAWAYYRTLPKERYPAEKASLGQLTHAAMRVRFLGVFDTVGALGIPRKSLNGLGRRTFQFHDTEVSSIVDHSCHALAIDEKRMEFEAAVWTEPRHRGYKTVEQVWFPGVHSNVGGGYDDSGLSDLALEWMVQRAAKFCPELRLKDEDLRQNHHGQLYESRSWAYWRSVRKPLVRLINRCVVPGHYRLATVKPHSRPIAEMLHWSALARWVETKALAPDKRYCPPNLVAALEAVVRDTILIAAPDGEGRKFSELSLQHATPHSLPLA